MNLQLPTISEVEQELSRLSREAALLRGLRKSLKKIDRQSTAAERLGALQDQLPHDEGQSK